MTLTKLYAVPGTYTVTLTVNWTGHTATGDTSGNGTKRDTVLVLSSCDGPVISGQPSNEVVVAGATAQFTVGASSYFPMSYQWYFNQTNPIVSPAAFATLMLPNVTTNAAGAYSVVIANAYGSVTSSVATLTVEVPPSVPNGLGNLTVSSGGNASFSVSAGGSGPLTYQWQFNGTNIPGATASVLSLTNTPTGSAGVYKVLITGPGGTTSASALLTVGTTLGVFQNANQMILNWSGPWALQSATNANGPYADIPGAASPFTNLMSAAPKEFFRLRSTAVNAVTAIGSSPGGFVVGASGIPGYNYVIEASTNLINWTAIQTNSVPFQFIDVNASNYPMRFYRTVLVQ